MLLGLEFNSGLDLNKTLQISTLAFFGGARCAELLRELSRMQNKTRQMIPDLVNIESRFFKTAVVTKHYLKIRRLKS